MKYIINFLLENFYAFIKPKNIFILVLAFFFLTDIRYYINKLLIYILDDTVNVYVLTFISFLLSVLLFRFIIGLINILFQKFLVDDKKNLDVSKIFLDYDVISSENLEHWAKLNGLYNKVPESLWIELREEIKSCKFKNYNTNITLNNIKLKNNSLENLVKIKAKIIRLLEK